MFIKTKAEVVSASPFGRGEGRGGEREDAFLLDVFASLQINRILCIKILRTVLLTHFSILILTFATLLQMNKQINFNNIRLI